MKKIKQFIVPCTMMSFIIAPWMAHAVTVPEIGECVGGTCPSDAEYIDGFMFGCGTQSSCYCLNSDGEGWDIPCSCWEDSQCGTSGWGCIDGECQKCKTCSNCTGSSAWEDDGTGRQRKTTKQCACDGTCNVYYQYRCTAGYYGSNNCSRCPSDGNSALGSTSITDCYITSGDDDSGLFSFSANCYYKN